MMTHTYEGWAAVEIIGRGVREYDDYYDGCGLEDYECPNCGKKFTVEIPR